MRTNNLQDAQSTDPPYPMEWSPDALQFEQPAQFRDNAQHLLNS
jgi:hypothetical protein